MQSDLNYDVLKKLHIWGCPTYVLEPMFNDGKKIALYCSDVQGAFDRVPSGRLIEKLSAIGLHPRIVRLLKS